MKTDTSSSQKVKYDFNTNADAVAAQAFLE